MNRDSQESPGPETSSSVPGGGADARAQRDGKAVESGKISGSDSLVSGALRARLRELRHRPRVLVTAVALAAGFVLVEIWGSDLARWLGASKEFVFGHPTATVGVLVVLLYVFVGPRNVRTLATRSLESAKRHPKVSTVVLVLLVLGGIWFVENYNAIMILPFSVGHGSIGSNELDGVKLAAELSAAFSRRSPEVRLWSQPEEPEISLGSVFLLSELPFEEWKDECPGLLAGPSSFRFFRTLGIPEGGFPHANSGGGGTNINLGPVSIPSVLLTRILYRVLPTRSRLFEGQIVETDGDLKISIWQVGSQKRWTVMGPSEARTEMMDYLALRIGVDTSDEPQRVSDVTMAFALGAEAFRQGLYQAATRFFQIADRLARLNVTVNRMEALSHYQLARHGSDPDTPSPEFLGAIRKMGHAWDAAIDRHDTPFRPVLACLYEEAGRSEDEVRAHFEAFRHDLRKLRVPSPDGRIGALNRLPLSGPSRHLSLDGGVVTAVNGAGNIVHHVGPQGREAQIPTRGRPRQIALLRPSTLLYLSADGSLRSRAISAPSESEATTLIEGYELQGINQFAVRATDSGPSDLFLIDRPGRVHRCRLDAPATPCSPTQLRFDRPLIVRQIVFRDELYLLAADSSVWAVRLDEGGAPLETRVLARRPSVKEFFVSSGRLYLLHDNGNVWDGSLHADGKRLIDLRFIDSGTGTRQVFAESDLLYVLKNRGDIWRTDPLASRPDWEPIFRPWDQLPKAAEHKAVGVREMYATACSANPASLESKDGADASDSVDRTPACRTIVYFLTSDWDVYRGEDSGTGTLENLTRLGPS